MLTIKVLKQAAHYKIDLIDFYNTYFLSLSRFASSNKMGRKCCVPECKTGYASAEKDPIISTHSIPSNPELRQQWIRNIPRQD